MSQTYTSPAPATSGTLALHRWLPLAVWAAFTLGAIAYVVVIGTNAPYADEWEFVPALLGEEPVLPWLWQQHNEHRLPLPRAVYLTLFKLTHDFRAGMLLQVAILSALALWLMRLAAKLRGQPHWADAFFPVSLLHVGHWENFVMGYQLCFVLFTLFATSLAVIALRITQANAFRSGVLASILLMLLALTGGSGLAVVPPVVLWLMFVAVSVWQTGAKGKAALLMFLALLPAAYLGVYFINYQKPPGHPDLSFNPLAVAPVSGAVLALAPGVGLSGVWWLVCAGELILGVLTIAFLLRRGRSESLSTAGLIATAAGITGVAVAIGSARAEWGTERVLQFARYSLLVWPLLATTYLVWVKLGGSWYSQPDATKAPRPQPDSSCSSWNSQPVADKAPRPRPDSGCSKWIPILLCVVAALAFPTNTGTGMLNGAFVKSKYSAIEADAASGMSAEQLVQQHFPDSPQAGQEERALHAIPMLRAARIGIFARNQ